MHRSVNAMALLSACGEPYTSRGVCLVSNDRNALAATFERECLGAIRRRGNWSTKYLKRVARSGAARPLESEGVLIPVSIQGLTRTEVGKSVRRGDGKSPSGV